MSKKRKDQAQSQVDAAQEAETGAAFVPDSDDLFELAEQKGCLDAVGQTTLTLKVSYRGSFFHGFAKQPGQVTVQGEIEQALEKLFRRPVETVCAGRTDSGVNALGQIVSFLVMAEEITGRSKRKTMRSLNALTHDAIAIRDIEVRDAGFSARFSAIAREYRYFIITSSPMPLLMEHVAWHVGKPLDLDAMRKAASYLLGEHDFKSFCMAASAEGKSTNRFIDSITIEPFSSWGDDAVCITIVGNAFLHSMVRAIVGSLVLVGRGRRTPEWMDAALKACDRQAAGENAPAQGLTFWRVFYSKDEFAQFRQTRGAIQRDLMYQELANDAQEGLARGADNIGLNDVLMDEYEESSLKDFFESRMTHKGRAKRKDEQKIRIPRGSVRHGNEQVVTGAPQSGSSGTQYYGMISTEEVDEGRFGDLELQFTQEAVSTPEEPVGENLPYQTLQELTDEVGVIVEPEGIEEPDGVDALRNKLRVEQVRKLKPFAGSSWSQDKDQDDSGDVNQDEGSSIGGSNREESPSAAQEDSISDDARTPQQDRQLESATSQENKPQLVRSARFPFQRK